MPAWEITHVFRVLWEPAYVLVLFGFFFFLSVFFPPHFRKTVKHMRTISKGSGLTNTSVYEKLFEEFEVC